MNFKEELAAKDQIDNKHVHRGHDQDTGSKSSESG